MALRDIFFKRGQIANFNQLLREGEPAFILDKGWLFVGNGEENVKIGGIENDEEFPQHNRYYGTNAAGVKGYHSISELGLNIEQLQPELDTFLQNSLKTIEGQSIIGNGDITIITDALYSQILNMVISFLQNNVKTINGTSLFGAGNIVVSGGVGEVLEPIMYYDGVNDPEFIYVNGDILTGVLEEM